MTFLLVTAGIYLMLGLLLTIPLSETMFMIGLTLIFLLIVVIHGWKTLGPRELFVFFLLAYSLTLIYEFTDGLGFGEFVHCRAYYSDLLGPKFFSKVPYVIPLVWSIALYCAFTMTNILFNRLRITHTFEEIVTGTWFLKIGGMGVVTGSIMVSWDLIADPVLVKMGAWSWMYDGDYFNIPIWNYEAWLEIPLVFFVIYTYYLYKVGKSQCYIDGEKKSVYTLFVAILYLGLLLLFSIYAFYVEIIYAIPFAAIAMGACVIITVVKFYRYRSK
ncbi:MAG: carotenoid biosynthesis protein [Candidatus Thermoplasmatota archaeon]|nr:carotenoid biosynthesis protein [Candidatus Thermoplasmatota archaeon]